MIELNASCNRNGKRIISDLMEATQSHAVKKNCLLNTIKGLVINICYTNNVILKTLYLVFSNL